MQHVKKTTTLKQQQQTQKDVNRILGFYPLREPAASTMALWWLKRFIMAKLLFSFTVLLGLDVEAAVDNP